MKYLFILSLIFLFYVFLVYCDSEKKDLSKETASSKENYIPYPDIPPHRSFDEYVKKFTIPQLQQILKDRGTTCPGCLKKKDLAKYIADFAQYMPQIKKLSKQDIEESQKAKELAEQWNKENANKREYDMVMGLFRDQEEGKKNLITKEVIKKLQNQGHDTRFIKKVNPWDTFPSMKEPSIEIPEEERMQQLSEGELEDYVDERDEL